MNIENQLSNNIQKAFHNLFDATVPVNELVLESTKKEFEGNITFVVFPFLRYSKTTPEITAEKIGNYLVEQSELIQSFQVVKGFLNLTIAPAIWTEFLNNTFSNSNFGKPLSKPTEKVMVEYSSPNTNKPLHLGHIRNNLLGFSLASLLEYYGFEVTKVNLINDRGIHICKSMIAWQKYGNGETPEFSGLKGDKLVGKYYVEFDKVYKTQIEKLVSEGKTKEEAENETPILKEAREMLLKWEKNDPEVIELWKKMNGWVYAGFDETYKNLGVNFDKFYYESSTYKLGKDIVDEGLAKSIFNREADGSVWIDLSNEGLDKKLLLRSDGTSVYMTQDLGTADLKFKDFNPDRSIYVVGNEQDYHFKVLFTILNKLQRPYTKGLYHLSYGMVDLPSGKMKSREGTVVDADDLIATMYETAKQKSEELGKTDGMSEDDLDNLFRNVSLGALKFYLLKVEPSKRLLFNPEESIDFHGDTGPFVQYTYARICSVLRQAGDSWKTITSNSSIWHETESETLHTLYRFPDELKKAVETYNPAILAAYCLKLAKAFNRVYKEVSLLKEPDEDIKIQRLKLSAKTGEVIKTCMNLLGINCPERM